MTTSHRTTRRRAETTPQRLALYAVLIVALGLPLLFLVPAQYIPLLTVALLVGFAIVVRSALRARGRER